MEKVKSILGKGDKHDSTSSTTDSSGTTGTGSTHGHSHSHPTGTSATTGTDRYETQDERIAPAVEHERVKNVHEERTQLALDKERHQDHYHTTVQPVQDREVLPTAHQHQTAAVEHREFEHEDAAKTKAALEAQDAQFKNTTTTHGTAATHSKLDTIATEHTHHHLHETIQPVIEKETVQPSVTHTTVPIKEVHHEAAHIHGTTTAAPITAAELRETDAYGHGLTDTKRTTHSSGTGI